MLKHLFFSCVIVLLFQLASPAQVPYNSAAPNGYTRKASVTEQVGLTEVSITYHRPAVNGREGRIWGGVVHNGLANLGFGNGNPAPWRAGANENTIIAFDHDVLIGGKPLRQGRYGFFVAYDANESMLIFSKRSDGWGAFFYDEKEDALRIKVRPKEIEKSIERLKFEFSDQTPNSATVSLSWEKLSLPFNIEVDLKKQQFDAFVAESQNPRGFTSQGLTIAAGWALQNDYELEKALEWASLASSTNFPGDPTSFPALTTKAAILNKLGRRDEAAPVIKTALPLGTVAQVQQFGKQLLMLENPKAAMEVFQHNYDKHPDNFIALAGIARGHSATGNPGKALEFATKALESAPDESGRQAIQEMIGKLKAGKTIQ